MITFLKKFGLKSVGPYNILPEPENYTQTKQFYRCQRKVVIFSSPHKFACSVASLAKYWEQVEVN